MGFAEEARVERDVVEQKNKCENNRDRGLQKGKTTRRGKRAQGKSEGGSIMKGGALHMKSKKEKEKEEIYEYKETLTVAV